MNESLKTSIILVADDEPHVALEYQFLLCNNDCRIIKAYSGNEAFEKAKEESPDLIILDIMMPESNETIGVIDPLQGVKLFKRLKNEPKTKNIPIIFSSINAKARHIASEELKAEGFFAKFYDDDEKFKCIDEILKKKTKSSENSL